MSGQAIPRVRRLDVIEGGRRRIVLIPLTGDRSYDDYLREAEMEKTRDELRKLGPKNIITKPTREEAIKLMRDFARWVNWKRSGGKLYRGG